ncbi:MAG: PEP-CTERM sorting domain-containing protein [Burkholderiales bacterium]
MKKLLTLALVSLPMLASAQNMLTNGSFENGFAGWTLAPGNLQTNATTITYGVAAPYPTGAFGEAVTADNAAGNPGYDAVGTHGAYFVDDFAKPETLTQQVSITNGTQYTFGFDAYLPANGFANAGDATFSATVGGFTFADFTVSQGSAQNWVHYSATGFGTGNGLVDFTFTFNTNMYPSKDVVIDRVYFAATPAVPEPETYALMLGGLAAMGFVARRRRSV